MSAPNVSQKPLNDLNGGSKAVSNGKTHSLPDGLDVDTPTDSRSVEKVVARSRPWPRALEDAANLDSTQSSPRLHENKAGTCTPQSVKFKSQLSVDLGDGTVVTVPGTPDSELDDGSKISVLSRPAGNDEVDRTSVYSLYMEKDFRYYFQHPWLRLFFAYTVTLCNFIIYAEDPVAHSEAECFIPVVGNCFAFVFTRYPRNAWAIVKVLTWLIAIILGMILGKLLVHKIVLNRLFKLKMFLDDQGSWMTMFFTVVFSLFVFSHVYNLILLIGGDSTVPYRISHNMAIKNSLFLKAAACGTWCGDFFTAWMVTDIMLQDKLYPHFGVRARTWWNRGWNRIVLFWVVTGAMSFVVILFICTDWIKWDEMNKDLLPSNEVSRAFMASFILVFDLLILMQDWDFPHFINNFDIKLPGLNTAHIKFTIPRRLERAWVVHITGKWFNYGILFMVLIMDLNMWKNQIFYNPYEYGQYTDSENKVHTVKDDFSLANHNETRLSYDWRTNNTNPLTNLTYFEGDMIMNSRYLGFPLSVKCIAFVPSISAFICFGVLIWYFGRWHPTSDDPHGGRLKKRDKKRRFSFGRWSSRRRSGQITVKVVKNLKDDGPSVIFEGKEAKDYIPLTEDNKISPEEADAAAGRP